MTGSIQTSPLLALPLELRIEVYKQCLNPDPERVHTLYHDRHGREASFGLVPNILRVNKQIYSEAISILYDNARVSIYLGTAIDRKRTDGNYSDGIDDPPALFRLNKVDAYEREYVLSRFPIQCDVQSSVRGPESQRRLEAAAPGYIYPQCFQRLRNIQVVTSLPAIWGYDSGGVFFSYIGRTVLWILDLLAEKQVGESPVTRSVKFSIQLVFGQVETPLLMRIDENVSKTKSIVGLRDALKGITNVEIHIEEGVLTKVLRDLKDDEADEWEKMLGGYEKFTLDFLATSDIELFEICTRYPGKAQSILREQVELERGNSWQD